jgi:hypothetical protein
MPTPVSNIYPGSTTYTHEVGLALPSSLKWGLRLRDGIASIRDNAPQTTAPVDLITQFSYHLGRGHESFLDKHRHFGYWDAKDAWLQTVGKAHPTILWKFAKGIKSWDGNWIGSVTWKKINSNSDPYLSVAWSSAGLSGTNLLIPIRRRGNPGTLTITARANNGGDPHASTIHQTFTVTKADVTDTVVYFLELGASAFSYVALTTYHLVFTSSDTNDENCWEIGCAPSAAGKRSATGANGSWTATTYSPYFRISPAATAQRVFMFQYDSAMYAVVTPLSGSNSTLYINGGRGKATSGTASTLTDSALGMTTDRYVGAWIQIIRGTGAGQARQIASNTATAFTVTVDWDISPASGSVYVIYKTPWFHSVGSTGIDGFTSAAAGSAGLSNVSSKPDSVNNIVYFPQGDATGMRRMQWNDSTKVHDFGAETATGNQGTATFICRGHDPASGPILWRANNNTITGSGGAQTVSRANAVAWGVALAFVLPNAGGTKGIYVGSTNSIITGMTSHSDGALYVHKEDNLFMVSNDRSIGRQYGAQDMPSIANGQALITAGSALYISFQNTLMQMIGGTITDTKLWLSNLPSTRVGRIRDGRSALSWLFLALDAKFAGRSSVLVWINEAQAWHENFRGFRDNLRIRNVHWQPNDETHPYLWTEMGSELVYQAFPQTPRPLNDPDLEYMPECVVETSTIDLNTNPKFFGQLKAITKNLSSSGMEIFVDYQMDNYVGSTTWFAAGALVESPEDTLEIGVGDKRKLRLRFRMNTDVSTTPPIMENWSLEFFERTPFATYVTLDCEVAPSQTTVHGGGQDHKPSELFRALQEMYKRAQVIRLESIDPTLHGKTATMYAPPDAEKTSTDRSKEFTGAIRVHLLIPAKEEEVK